MTTWLWAAVLVASAVATHWGAEQLANPLHKLTRRWGLSAAAGGALVALVTAGSEIGINTTSALRGVSDIGLGMSLGSNVIAIPLTVIVVYFATRTKRLGNGQEGEEEGEEDTKEATETSGQHQRHLETHLLRVERKAVTVLTLPYLALLALLALLTLPAPWRGLQPVDALFLLLGYGAYLTQAVLRGRQKGEKEEWSRKEKVRAAAGIVVLGIGAYFVTRSSENIASALGLSNIVTGLFITATVTALPELFGAWSVARSGQVTAATTSVIGDHAVTLSVALVPLALVTLPIQNLQLYTVNLVFVALIPTLYAALIHWGSDQHGFKRWQVAALGGTYLVYLGVMLFWVLDVL
jgi:cation:H+ antiporter